MPPPSLTSQTGNLLRREEGNVVWVLRRLLGYTQETGPVGQSMDAEIQVEEVGCSGEVARGSKGSSLRLRVHFNKKTALSDGVDVGVR